MAQENQVGILNRYPILTGIIDRITLVALTWLVSKGFITNSDVATLAPLVPLILAAAVGWYQNRQVALAEAASTIPDTKIVTTAAVDEATPANKNIVSNEEKKVVSQ